MKKKAKRKLSGVVAIALVLSIVMISASSAAAASGVNVIANTPIGESIHKKINISDITGEIAEPPMLTSAASSVAEEKEWYEYVYYSTEPVGYYYLNDVARIAFFDPYDYASSLIMEVDDSITDWSSNNTLQVSYTTGSSLSDTNGTSGSTTSTIQVQNGQDVSESNTDASTVITTVEGNTDTYNWSKKGTTQTTTDGSSSEHSATEKGTWSISETILGEIDSGAGAYSVAWLSTKSGINVTNKNDFGVDNTEKVGSSHSGSTTVQLNDDYSHGYTDNSSTSTTRNEGAHTIVTSTIADRITRATGSTVNDSITMSTNNSTTVTKTYNAGYFNASGSPLQWKVVKYTVLMPMKYQVEYYVDGEWIFGDYNYCLLKTVQGTCRAWLQNNVAYYEHWGTGEAVTWNEFWSSFFTRESLIQAYKNKLYPDN